MEVNTLCLCGNMEVKKTDFILFYLILERSIIICNPCRSTETPAWKGYFYIRIEPNTIQNDIANADFQYDADSTLGHIKYKTRNVSKFFLLFLVSL